MMKVWWRRVGNNGMGGQMCLNRMSVACIQRKYDIFFMYLLVSTWRRERPVQPRCVSPARETSRPQTPPWSPVSVNTDSTKKQHWPWVNTKANTWGQAADTREYTRTHTTGEPITAAHYWAGQVQVLTRATINPWILSGLLDVRAEQLTRLNVRAVASVMRQDNYAVFQPEQVNSHWPWGLYPTSRFMLDLLCLEWPSLVPGSDVVVCHQSNKPNYCWCCLTHTNTEEDGKAGYRLLHASHVSQSKRVQGKVPLFYKETLSLMSNS